MANQWIKFIKRNGY